MAEPAIRFERFTCRYAPSAPPILDELSLEIWPGEYVFILGAGGEGKTTLGLTLNGVIPNIRGQAEGALYVNGTPTSELTVAELATRVGMVFQDVEGQLCMLHVHDEVAFGPENLCLEKEEVIRRVADALRLVGIEHLSDRSIFELSGGEKQKVALAAVLALEPDILFLDEPAANLDPKSSAEIVDVVRRLKGRKTILVFENKVDEFLPEADRLIVLHEGKVALDGPPRDILAAHGERLLDQMGIWIPQPAALTLGSKRLALTVEEAVEVLAVEPGFSVEERSPYAASVAEGADTAARVESLSYRYEASTGSALSDVSLTIAEGEWLALVGPNGSGKTTLAKHLIGLLKPQQGTVDIFGHDTRTTPIRELAHTVGYVFQNPEHQFVTDKVQDELRFSLRAAGTPEQSIDAMVEEALVRFDLSGLQARHPYSLSGGEKRRLSVATMLINRPRMLILDEPTYGLDRRNTLQMARSVVESARSRQDGHAATVVMVTHDMRLVADYATSVAVMSEGRLAYQGSVPALFANEELLVRCNLEVPAVTRIRRLLAERALSPAGS
jgi:energy-coupling factor transport system ATP-binding protein